MSVTIVVTMMAGVVTGSLSVVLSIFLKSLFTPLQGWPLAPFLVGLIVTAIFWLLRVVPSQPICDLFETYLFGSFRAGSIVWLIRSVLSFFNAFVLGVFGFSGGLIEISAALFPIFNRLPKVFFEEKQVFVISIVSAALSVVIGAPFSCALIALEIFHVLEARVRVSSIIASLAASGTVLVLCSTLFSGYRFGPQFGSENILSILYTGYHSQAHSLRGHIGLIGLSMTMGMLAVGLSFLINSLLSKVPYLFDKLLPESKKIFPYRILITGFLVSISLWLSKDLVTQPGKLWDDLAWLHLSSSGALVSICSRITLFILVFAGWGGTGVFTPILTLGALMGFCLGNAINASVAVQMAIVGAVSTLSSTFRLPLASAALVFEVTHNGSLLVYSMVSIGTVALLRAVIKFKSFQESLLEIHGIRLTGGRSTSVLAKLKVSSAMDSQVECISEEANLQQLRDAAQRSGHSFIGITMSDGNYKGLLPLDLLSTKIRRVIGQSATPHEVEVVSRIFEVRDLIETRIPTMNPDDNLEAALHHFRFFPCVAVVNAEGKLCGLLFESDVIGRYKREISSRAIKV